jgi:hypothetical protein
MLAMKYVLTLAYGFVLLPGRVAFILLEFSLVLSFGFAGV